jgi:integrase
MKLIELPKSPYWGANVHVGFYPDGKKRYSPRSSKVVRDPSRVGPGGVREDKVEAMALLTALQTVANQAMQMETDRVSRQDFEEMVAGVLRAVGKKLTPTAPSWESFSSDVLSRHCQDLSPATVRSYWSKKAGFDGWLGLSGRKSQLTAESRLSEFRLDDIQEFYDWRLSEGGGASTANAAVKCLSMIFARAIVSDHIAKNPCAGVSKRFVKAKSKKPFTVSDFSLITGALVDHRDRIEFADEWSLAIRFAIFTGAREGDCVGLRWSDFSDDFRLVTFVPNKKSRLHDLGKTDATVSLMLPEFVASMFRAAREASTSEFVTPALRAIIPGKNGLGARFRAIMDLAGVKYETIAAKGPKSIAQCSHGFHSFRHSLKTELRAAGVSAESSNFLTGHSDEKVAAKYVTEKVETIFRECSGVFAEFEAALKA